MDSSSYRLAECHVPVAGSDAGKGRERLHKKPNRGRSPPELLEVAKTPNRQLCFLRLIIEHPEVSTQRRLVRQQINHRHERDFPFYFNNRPVVLPLRATAWLSLWLSRAFVPWKSMASDRGLPRFLPKVHWQNPGTPPTNIFTSQGFPPCT